MKSLFFAASSLDPAERAAFLAQHPEAGPQTRARLDEMLSDSDSAGSFLDSPPSSSASNETEVVAVLNPQLSAGDLVCDRYRIRRYVARGGMGEVYEADDLDMEIVVAIKVLRPEVFAGADLVARFKREIDLARRVSHPNIGRIHDIGHFVRADGQNTTFLTMEFLSGETLAQCIARAGAIPPPEAAPLIRDMALALDAIHSNGIVHRDFKSSNVMLVAQPGGKPCARVMDFGLARPIQAGDNTLTRTGFISGTPSYMAPEQFEGISTPASDVYSMGVVLHEMLTGLRPSAARSMQTTVGMAGVPAPWSPLVRRCLALRPADRFQNAAELLDALPGNPVSRPQPVANVPRVRRWVLASAAAVALMGLLTYGLLNRRAVPPPEESPRHLALLPILSESVDPLDAAFCAGFSDTIRGDLAEMETASKNSFWVVPSAEVRSIKTATQAYREVGANLVLVATLHRGSQGVSLTAELVDPKNMHLLKSARIEVQNLSALRQAADTRIAELLGVPVAKALTREVAASSTNEPGAFEFYEQGLGYLRADTIKNADHAIDLFKEALETDKNYALAYSGLGEAYAYKYDSTKDPEWIKLAVEGGNKAIALNGDLAQVHSTMSMISRMTGRPDRAIEESQKALAIQPSCMDCYYQLGVVYGQLGDFAGAERSFQTIVLHQRGNARGYSGLGWVAQKKGNYAKAAEMFKRAFDLAPDRPRAAANLGGVYTLQGKYEQAVPVLQRALSLDANDQVYGNLAAALMYLHRYKEASDAMEHAVQLFPNKHDNWRNLADSYRQVTGLKEKAPAAYRKALECATAELRVKPGDSDLLSSIGLYHAHLGDKRAAAVFTERALKISPEDSSVLFTAALSAELTGHRKEVLNYLAESAKAGYPLSSIEKEPELAGLSSDPDYRQWIEQTQNAARNLAGGK